MIVFVGGIGYTIGSVLQKKFAWICIMIYAPVLIFLSLYNRIYANSVLYGYFFIQAIIAYRKWNNNDTTKPSLQPSFANNTKRGIVGLICFLIFVSIYTFFIKFTNNSSPLLDSVIFSIKVAAMYFTSFKNVEGVVLMGTGNLLSALMFVFNGLYISSPMYIFSFVFNSYGTYKWLKQIKK
jgi:nicotinamide mononucleotide transporter PnuC